MQNCSNWKHFKITHIIQYLCTFLHYAEFNESFKSILQIGGISLNVTTFNNLQTTGEIRLIRDKSLADRIVKYYNTHYTVWETGLRDYTRNIIAPYILKFDHLPKYNLEDNRGNIISMSGEYDFKKAGKDLEAYKDDYFITNALRQKNFILEGLLILYNDLLDSAKELDKEIRHYLDREWARESPK